MRNGPPLVNGRGPIDGFFSRRRPASPDENMVIDLSDSNTLSPVKCLVLPAPDTSRLPQEDQHQSKDKTTSSGKFSNVERTPKTHTSDCIVVNDESEEGDEMEEGKDENQTSISQLDTTQDSDSELEEHNESGNVSSLGNRSMLSASSVSSMSESSPEKSIADDPTPTTTPTVCSVQLLFFSFCSVPLSCLILTTFL